MPETKELPSAFQGPGSPFKNQINRISESSPEILNEKEIKDSYKLGDTSRVSTLIDTLSQLVSKENCATATTDNKEQSASLEKVPEIHAEECIKSDEIDIEKNHQTISGGIVANEKTVLTSEAHQATICDVATEEVVNHTDVQGANQDLPDQETKEQSQDKDQLDSARSLGEDEKQMTFAKNTEVLGEKVLNSRQTTELPDKAEEAITEDEEKRRIESNPSLLSGQKEDQHGLILNAAIPPSWTERRKVDPGGTAASASLPWEKVFHDFPKDLRANPFCGRGVLIHIGDPLCTFRSHDNAVRAKSSHGG